MASKAIDPTTTNDMFLFLIFSCETTINKVKSFCPSQIIPSKAVST